MSSPTRQKPFSASTQHLVGPNGAIEWEEMPSLANRLVKGEGADSRFHANAADESTWGETKPAGLDEPAAPSQPFVEKVEGLATREVVEPDVFSYFFGRNAEG